MHEEKTAPWGGGIDELCYFNMIPGLTARYPRRRFPPFLLHPPVFFHAHVCGKCPYSGPAGGRGPFYHCSAELGSAADCMRARGSAVRRLAAHFHERVGSRMNGKLWCAARLEVPYAADGSFWNAELRLRTTASESVYFGGVEGEGLP